MDYQETLNLPKTDFSMKAGLVQKEPLILARWEKDKIYLRLREKSQNRPAFILHDGPPYANGHIHIGHALNKILKDMIIRYKTMKGFDALYVPGWDCHGLPIEHQLLKDSKQSKSQIQMIPFRQSAHDYAMKFVGIQRDEFKRLGIWAEWENPYLTLTPGYEYWILKSLSDLVAKGYVYRRLKPVNWCYSCETALAEAEVEHENKESPTVFVLFKVKNFSQLDLGGVSQLSLLVWTTTPWTLLANVAVAAHPDIEYGVYPYLNQHVILSQALAEKVFQKIGMPLPVAVKKLKGSDLSGLTYEHPFGKLSSCSVVMADYVTQEDGTGLVHTAPGHGQDDYQTGLKYQLPVRMPVNMRGVFTEDGSPFAGQHVFKANDEIINHLRNQQVLFFTEKIVHSYPHCWRCKNPIIFRATEQWFLSIDHDNLRQRLRNAIENEVQWIPSAGRERILGMIATRPDWCLSRQRAWGVPIPALICKGCHDEQKLDVKVIDHVANLVKEEGTDAWFKREVKDLVPANFVCPQCSGRDFAKANDILDVWFDSGVSHQAVFKTLIHRPLPADLYLEGSDQHRGWFQSSLIPSVALNNHPPYRQVLTHGFVVDGAGRKMSKSLGNVIKPQDMIDQNGADILRLWVAASSYHDDVRISKEIVERLVDAYRKIRNTVRYLLGNTHGFSAQEALAYEKLLPLDQWALHQLAKAIEEADKAYDAYDFVAVFKVIYAFCNETLSSIYLDILKDRLYTCATFSRERLSAQTVLYHTLTALTRIMAPILVFTSDEIYQMNTSENISDCPSVHLAAWPKVDNQWVNEGIHQHFASLMEMRDKVLKALDQKRKAGDIGSALEARIVIQTQDEKQYQYLKSLENSLASIFIVSKVDIQSSQNWQVDVYPADGTKCARCWKYTNDVGQITQHPTVCLSCATTVDDILSKRK